MNIGQLQPASALAKRFGVKAVMFGGPGTGKTPLVQSAPRPVLLVVEPGMMSMRKSNIPCFEAYTPPLIEDFFNWVLNSKEASNFDTIGVDSVSQIAEIFLTQELARNKDGRKAYGEMSIRVMQILNKLYFMPQKHIYLIAKQQIADDNGVTRKRPYFPGQDLNVKVPHLFDEVLHLGLTRIPGVVSEVMAIRCKESYDTMARDRSGNLNEFEQPDLGQLFQKVMQ